MLFERLLPSRLRGRLLFLLLVAVLPPILVLGGVLVEQRDQAEADAREWARQLVRIATLQHRHALAMARQSVGALVRMRAVQDHDRSACEPLFETLLTDNPSFAAIGVTDARGRVVAAAGDLLVGVNLSRRGWFRRALAGPTLGAPLADQTPGKPPSIVYAAPVRDASGIVRSVVVLLQRLDWLGQAGDELGLMRGGTLTIFDADGMILARHPDQERFAGRRAPDMPLVREAIRRGHGVAELPGLDGVTRLFAIEPLEGPLEHPLWAAVGVSLEDAFASSRRAFARSLAVLVLFGCVLVIASWHGLRLAVLRKLEALLNASRRVTAGDGSVRAGPPYGSDELGEVARAFDDMLGTLDRQQAEREHATRALRESEAVKRAVFESAPDAIVTIDASGHILECNGAAEQMLGVSRREAQGRDLLELVLPPGMLRAMRRDLGVWDRTGYSLNAGAPIETHVIRPDRGEVPARVTFTRIGDGNDRTRFSVHVRDLSDEHRLLDALRAMSLVDDLTGLYNRRGFLALGRQQLRFAVRNFTHVLLLFGDLDNLKAINDGFGHAGGDDAIREAAQVLREVFRASDVVARVGGDEFAVLAPDPLRAGGAATVMRLRDRIAAHNQGGGRPWPLEMSIGVAYWDPVEPRSIEDLLAEGDAKMYAQKRARADRRAG